MTIKGRQLFVGNLPFVVGWQDLKDLFRSAGNVQRANIMQSRDGRSKGHGIVLFATVADAQKAISTFDGYEWHGRRLEVREDRSAMDYPPPPPRTESAANSMIQNETENEMLATPNGIITTTTITEFNGSGSASNTQVSSPVDSSENISLANGTSNGTYAVDESTTSTIATTTGSGSTAVNGVGGNIQRQLFVGNLPFRVRWQDLKDLFRKAGTVLRADVAMGYDNRSKGHGTVLFASLDDAKNAIQIFHNYSWQGRILEVREDRGFVDPNTINGNNLLSDPIRQAPETVLNQHSQSPFVPSAAMIAHGMFYGPRGIQAPAPNYAGRLLFVGNLPFNCQWQDLKDLFRNAGNIIRADVSTNYDGRSRGFGTVLFATPEDARKAVAMYNGFEYQGRTLRVHFDKFTLPTISPHPHAGPHPHLVPPLHQRPPPPLIPNLGHHNFHIGPPMHHPHFMPGPHIGPFSPPLTTPPLTSPPPFPATYNPLAHLGAAAQNATNGTNLFQSMQMINSAGSVHGSSTPQSTANQTQGLISHDQSLAAPPMPQFPLGPIGKSNVPLPIGVTSSTNSALGAVGAFPPVSGVINGTAGINTGTNGMDSSLGNGANNSIQSLTAAVAGLHLNPNPQQLFFHPAHHHPHHRPTVIPTAYHHPSLAAAAAAAAAHHLQQQQHPHHHHHQHHQPPNHTHHLHHNHPGAIGSGIVGGMSSNHHTNYHQQIHHHPHANEPSNLSSATTTAAANGLNSVSHSTSSPSVGVIDADANGTNNVIIGSAPSPIDVTSNQTNNPTNSNGATSSTNSAIMVSSNVIWDNGATGILSSNSTSSTNGPNGTNPASTSVMGIGMAATLAVLDASTGPGIPAATPQSVFVRNM